MCVSPRLTSRGGRPLVAVLCPLAVPREVSPVAALVAPHVGVEAATAAAASAASAAAAAALPAALLSLALEQKEHKRYYHPSYPKKSGLPHCAHNIFPSTHPKQDYLAYIFVEQHNVECCKFDVEKRGQNCRISR